MRIQTDLTASAIDGIVMLHTEYYAEHWGFGAFFEEKVASELTEFASRMKHNDLALVVSDDSGIAASLIMDLNDPQSGERGAHLRWFIAAQRCRGSGIGRELMQRAMNHANSYSDGKAWLTTFSGLDSARYLYESFEFELVHEAQGEAWGTQVTEQEFRRPTSASS